MSKIVPTFKVRRLIRDPGGKLQYQYLTLEPGLPKQEEGMSAYSWASEGIDGTAFILAEARRFLWHARKHKTDRAVLSHTVVPCQ